MKQPHLSFLPVRWNRKRRRDSGFHYLNGYFTIAAFHVLVQWHGFQPNASGFVPLSIAEFSL